MAFRRRATVLPFRDNRTLQQYVLTGVTPTGKILGTGSYGSVLEVMYGKLECAAKKMHEALLLTDNQGMENLVEKYEQECQIMASLRHPNITQFLGICYLPDTQLPLLVMEQLDMSLDDLLEYVPNLPLTLKVSFLEDICKGLDYLHKRDPPIIHRDLTAKNVLLTSSLSAKITDMGNSRIVSLRPGQQARTLSQLPGTLVYMPPEALSDDHRYGPSLDIFSFGHLALYTVIQEFPGNLLPYTYRDSNNPGHIQGRSEIERRAAYIETLEASKSLYSQSLIDLVKQCLDDIPEKRPASEDLLEQIHKIRKDVETSYGGSSLKHVDISRIHLAKDMRRSEEKKETEMRMQIEGKKREIVNLEQETERLHGQVRHQEDELQQRREAIEQHRQEIQEQRGEIQQKIEVLQQQTMEIQCLRENLQHKDEELNNFAEALDELHQRKKEVDLTIITLQKSLSESEEREKEHKLELTRLLEELQQCKKQLFLTKNNHFIFPLRVNWTRGPDMPIKMKGFFQALKIQEIVYVGGGVTDSGSILDDQIVITYNTHSCKWQQLPPHTTSLFAMVAINNQLVLVGGSDIQDAAKISLWDPISRRWTCPYKPMPTPRYSPSAVVYKQWLIVAGGLSGVQRLSTVEILDITNNQWYSAPPTPTPWSQMKSATLGDMWYLMGGYSDDIFPPPAVYSISLPDLISCVTSSISSFSHHYLWKEISGLGHCYSTPLCVGGALLAVGGKEIKDKNSVTTIHRYVPETEQWVEAGQLPSPTRDCACTFTSDQQLLVFGGYLSSNEYHVGTLY